MPNGTTTKPPPHTLVEGQRLDQPTFHALYEAMPPGTRAELIDGVVHMPSPVSLEHGEAQVPVITWLGYYAENTPGVRAAGNATTVLGWRSEPEPDVVAPPPFRLLPPNLMFTPAQSVSTWASRRTEEPGTWRNGPWIALRKPCIQASEAVTFSAEDAEAPEDPKRA